MDALSRIDYQDVFSVNCPAQMSTTEALLGFFNAAPWPVRWLLRVRNALVSLIGLKTEGHGFRLDASKIRTGERVGLFEMGTITRQTATVGADDAHLDFRVVLDIDREILSCTTQVKFNNKLGRIYFFFVKPFHRWIVPAMLRASVRYFERA